MYSYSDVIKNALVYRYSLIKYYYTSFYDISTQGGSFFKPLFYEYPLDPLAFKEIEINILLGSGLKLSMETTNLDFITNDSPSRNFYFPQARWCRIFPQITDSTTDCLDAAGGEASYLPLNTGLEDYYIHIRGGYIIPF